MDKKPKILFFDIETTPLISYTWGLYDQNVIAMQKDWELLSFAYKFQGDRDVTCIARRDFKDKTDRTLTKRLWKLLNEADIVVGHNAASFDCKKATAKFIEHGLPPHAPYEIVDTKLVAKKYFKFTSNKLDDLGRLLGVGRKEQTGGFDLWLDCMAGKPAAWRKMISYNKQDVLLLERVYDRLLPYTDNHPNVSFISGRPTGCPKCGSAKLKSMGVRRTKVSEYVRYRCMKCSGFCRGRVALKTAKPEVVNL